jgi:hypothetical protein
MASAGDAGQSRKERAGSPKGRERPRARSISICQFERLACGAIERPHPPHWVVGSRSPRKPSEEYEQETAVLVERHWPMIEAVANALLQKRVLSGYEIDNICQRVRRHELKTDAKHNRVPEVKSGKIARCANLRHISRRE